MSVTFSMISNNYKYYAVSKKEVSKKEYERDPYSIAAIPDETTGEYKYITRNYTEIPKGDVEKIERQNIEVIKIRKILDDKLDVELSTPNAISIIELLGITSNTPILPADFLEKIKHGTTILQQMKEQDVEELRETEGMPHLMGGPPNVISTGLSVDRSLVILEKLKTLCNAAMKEMIDSMMRGEPDMVKIFWA